MSYYSSWSVPYLVPSPSSPLPLFAPPPPPFTLPPFHPSPSSPSPLPVFPFTPLPLHPSPSSPLPFFTPPPLHPSPSPFTLREIFWNTEVSVFQEWRHVYFLPDSVTPSLKNLIELPIKDLFLFSLFK